MIEIRKKLAQLLLVSFDGPQLRTEWKRLLEECAPAGVVLFKRNWESLSQGLGLIGEIKSSSVELPPLIAIDHEGGRVHRLPKPFTHFPSARELGIVYEKEPWLIGDVGQAMARELKAVGIDLNLAPVLDVDINPFNPVIGDRSFGNNASKVAEIGALFIRAMQANGVASCGKHFPGHGDTDTDSHEVLPDLPHNLRRLRSLELVPFAKAIASDVACLMTAHVVYSGIDPEPATFSVKILRDLLRSEMKFEGVVISDDLTMGALAGYPLEQGCVKALKAGCDLLIIGQKGLPGIKEILDHLVEALESGVLPVERVEEACGRVRQMKAKYTSDQPSLDLSVLGCKVHRSII